MLLLLYSTLQQGRRRVLKSGPAEEMDEYRSGAQHERGNIPSGKGVRGCPPRKF